MVSSTTLSEATAYECPPPTVRLPNAMGLMPYAEARLHRYVVYDVNDGTEYPVTVESLIAALRLTGTATGDGRRVPDMDPSASRMRALLVVVTPQSRPLTSSEEAMMMALSQRLAAGWTTATWGRSTLDVGVIPRPSARAP